MLSMASFRINCVAKSLIANSSCDEIALNGRLCIILDCVSYFYSDNKKIMTMSQPFIVLLDLH